MVLAYLGESLDTFGRLTDRLHGDAGRRRGTCLDLVCGSIIVPLKSAKERSRLEGHLNSARIKPRIEFVQNKFVTLQSSGADDFPESATLMGTALYDMIRVQRNDLGHPPERPPRLDADEALARLHLFAAYYETAEQVRRYLNTHQE